MKKILLLLLACSLTSIPGFAQDSETLTWTFDSATGTLRISGTGERTNSSIDSSAPWRNVRSQIRQVEIGSDVANISYQSFSYSYSLTSINVDSRNARYASENGVLFNKEKTTLICCPAGKSGSYTLPNSVTRIDDFAFFVCSNLTSVSIPNGVTSIGDHVFAGCRGLTSIAIPDGVKSIGNRAFYGCTGLVSVSIAGSVTSIGNLAFFDCRSLTSLLCWNPDPATVDSSVFEEVNKKACILKVPAGSVKRYQQAPVWQDFSQIVAIEDSDSARRKTE